MEISKLERYFPSNTFQQAGEALTKDVYQGDRQTLLDFLDNMDTYHPYEIKKLSTGINELFIQADDLGVPLEAWPHYHRQSLLSILRMEIETQKKTGHTFEAVLNIFQNSTK